MQIQNDPHAEYRGDPEYTALVNKLRGNRLVMLGGSDFDALIGKLEAICNGNSHEAVIANECIRVLRHAENPDYKAGLTDQEQYQEAANRG